MDKSVIDIRSIYVDNGPYMSRDIPFVKYIHSYKERSEVPMHTHQNGQILSVKSGSGWVCEKGGSPQRLNVGDVVHCPVNATHWHGADDNSLMEHTAISLGKTTWHDEVAQSDYAAKGN